MQFSKLGKSQAYFTRIVFTTLLILSFSSWTYATQELKGERVSVVYDDPALYDFAQEVAQKATTAFNVLVELLNFEPRHTTLVIEDTTDGYNAFAITNPHLKVSLRPLFPTESELGFRTEDILYGLMLHELMHTAQLTYTATEPSEERRRTNERGIFTAGDVASVPPAWFIEGVATWIESEYGGGGRLEDAFTNGIIQSMALEDNLPSLTDISLTNFGQWPYGRARYLFGASFIDYLVNKYEFQAIIDTLHVYNQGGIIGGFLNDFSSAWFTVTGVPLNEEWSNWQKSHKAKAILRISDKPDTFTEVMSSFASSTLSPNGQQLAWVNGAQGILIADIIEADTSETSEAAIELQNTQVVLAEKAPRKIDWYSDNQLIYSRTIRDNLESFQRVFLLDINTGKETRFASEQRLKGATANLATGCVFTIRDVRPEPSLLVELCPVDNTTNIDSETIKTSSINAIWQAPKDAHFLNIAISPTGEVLVSLWDAGKTDLALLDTTTGELDLLMHDVGQDLDPAWRTKSSGETSIVFRSDRHVRGATLGVFDIYELEPKSRTQQKHRITRLSRTVGGAFQPISLNNETLLYSALGTSGFQLATLDVSSPNRISYVNSPDVTYRLKTAPNLAATFNTTDSAMNPVIDGFELQDYNPLRSMLPYAITPLVSVSNVDIFNLNLANANYSLAGSIFGEDLTGKHSYRISAGLNNILTGHLEGQYLLGSYNYSPTNVLTPVSQSPIDMGLSVGVWPHFPFGEGAVETALGAKAFVNLKLPNDIFVSYANLSAGFVNIQSRPSDWFFEGNARLMISKQRRDTWDYVIDGYRSAIFGAIGPSETGLSGGVWATTSYHDNLSSLGLAGIGISGIWEVYLQAGYKASQPIPITLNTDFSVLGQVGTRHTFDTTWRYGDGLYALERISIEPRVRTWYDSDLHVGADIGLYFDAIVNYLAPISVGVQVGYADEFWYKGGLKLPSF